MDSHFSAVFSHPQGLAQTSKSPATSTAHLKKYRVVFSISFTFHSHQCVLPAVAALGPHGTHVRPSPDTVLNGKHMALYFLPPPQAMLASDLTRTTPTPPTSATLLRVQTRSQALCISFPAIFPSHGLPFLATEGPSSPPCLGITVHTAYPLSLPHCAS